MADPVDSWWISSALNAVNRGADEPIVTGIASGLARAAEDDEVRSAQLSADCSAALHEATARLHFRKAGLDDELADALYSLDFDAAAHPFAHDAGVILRAAKEAGLLIGIVSDVHFDLRHEFALEGIESSIDTFVLSFEVHVQKPDPQIFRLALDALGVAAERTIMVGDRPGRDGGAVQVGIATVLLPTLRDAADSRLAQVLPLIA